MGRARALLVLSLLATACGTAVAGPPSPAGGAAASGLTTAAPGSGALGEQKSEAAGIAVAASWSVADQPSLKLSLDTHSGDLDTLDLAVLVRLRIDGGDWTAPTQADIPKGGHHRSGTVTFGAVSTAAFAAARVIELRVTDIGVAERLLRWERAG